MYSPQMRLRQGPLHFGQAGPLQLSKRRLPDQGVPMSRRARVPRDSEELSMSPLDDLRRRTRLRLVDAVPGAHRVYRWQVLHNSDVVDRAATEFMAELRARRFIGPDIKRWNSTAVAPVRARRPTTGQLP